ncbi:MAG TPA: hypothetical protein ENI11_03350 [Actinobacteria bacterium]|nr:hypothetical protein [Actinomycetota bacterium]
METMEPNIVPETKKSIWLNLKIVAPVMILAIAFAMIGAVIMTLRSPEAYTSDIKLRIEEHPSRRQNSGGVNTAIYIELINDPYFEKLVLREVSDATRTRTPTYRPFTVSARLIEKTTMFEISVEAPTSKTAKSLANAAAKALVKKGAEFRTSSTEFVAAKINEALEPVDKDLADLRTQLIQKQETASSGSGSDKAVKAGNLSDQIASQVRLRAQMASSPTLDVQTIDRDLARLRSALANLQTTPEIVNVNPDEAVSSAKLLDELQAKENVRNLLTNYLAQTAIDDLFDDETIKIVYSAELPRGPSSPSWSRNMSIAVLAGLLIGVALLSVADPIYRTR